jgi:hypothetical protein
VPAWAQAKPKDRPASMRNTKKRTNTIKTGLNTKIIRKQLPPLTTMLTIITRRYLMQARSDPTQAVAPLYSSLRTSYNQRSKLRTSTQMFM